MKQIRAILLNLYKSSRQIIRFLLFILWLGCAYIALVLPISLRPNNQAIHTGDVTQQSIQAPTSLTYVSRILSDDAKKMAEDKVQPVYLPIDSTISRRQIDLITSFYRYIDAIRSDQNASVEQKIHDLQQNQITHLAQTDYRLIIQLDQFRWDSVKQESINVVEQIMRTSIRENQLSEVKRKIPTFISYSLSSDLISLVEILVDPFIIPNCIFSLDMTEKARLDSRNNTPDVYQTYITGETIVERGAVITPIISEALSVYGLDHPVKEYTNHISEITLVVVSGLGIVFYLSRRNIPTIRNTRSLVIIGLLFMVFLVGMRTTTPNRAVIPYLFPLPAFAITMALLFNMEIGFLFSAVLCILASYGYPNSLDLFMYTILTSVFGVLVIGKGRRISKFIWAGLAIGLAGSSVIAVYRLPSGTIDIVGLATLTGASFVNGLASASISLVIQYLFAGLLGIATPMQLLDASRPDHPLLQFILRNAPGTYQHSLQVANLAEQAAEIIGGDALLVRVGALYHDTGKSLNPSMFIENQIPGNENPHNLLEPEESAAIIIRHVKDGVQLAKKYRLPNRIHDFIREHHGTLITRYQYSHALIKSGGIPEEINQELYKYPGPAPKSKETALLMLADGCEARARAELPVNESELREVVNSVIDYCQREGQLDNTTMTLNDLKNTADSFVKTLLNAYHPRLKYPEDTILSTKRNPVNNNHSPIIADERQVKKK